jgi:NADH-quinone oxidoreductase subunit K
MDSGSSPENAIRDKFSEKLMIFWEPILWSFPVVYITYNDFSAIHNFIFLSYTLYILSLWGLFFRRVSILQCLIIVELMFIALNFFFFLISLIFFDISFQPIILIVLAVSAAETAVILSLIYSYHKVTETTNLDFLNILKF